MQPSTQPITANGNYTILGYNKVPASCILWGTWGGASASLQFSPDDGSTWIAVSDDLTAITANGGANFCVGSNNLRLVVSGVTTTSLNCRIEPLSM